MMGGIDRRGGDDYNAYVWRCGMGDTQSSDMRRAFLAMAERRAAPGGGTHPDILRERSARYGTPDLRSIFGDVPYLVVGGLATRLFMQERMTLDVDILVDPEQLSEVESALRAKGGRRTGPLACGGSHWDVPGIGPCDVLALDVPWLAEALARPVSGPGGLPYIALPFLVLMKLASGRVQDLADITRMLGAAADDAMEDVRAAVNRHRPADRADIESMAGMGRLEYGTPR